MSIALRVVADGLEVRIRLTPNSSRDEVLGLDAGQVRIAVTAAPIDGRANEKLLRFLSKSLRVPFSSIAVIRGASARQKTIGISGDTDDLLAKLHDLVQ